ncbi:hypothetical protein BGZ60DRAFT_535191 [Tricladium varicosporioides]|nr:hypothetical protein BGZ60DRAFT_535191 [Hymenoscyphus varicosporioides]
MGNIWSSLAGRYLYKIIALPRILNNGGWTLFKNKGYDHPFVKPIQVSNPGGKGYTDMMIQLDTGYDGDGLITYEALEDHLNLINSMIPSDEVICLCLNGQELRSKGIIVLRWRGEGFRKVFKTTFHVIDGEFLPYQMLLGAKTIHKNGILKFAGFVGHAIHPKKSKKEKLNDPTRRQEHREKAAANDKKVAADKSAKEKAARTENSKDKASNKTRNRDDHY